MKVYIVAPCSQWYEEVVANAQMLLKSLDLTSYTPPLLSVKSMDKVLSVCLPNMSNCDIVFFLKDWAECSAAHLQYTVAIELGKDIWFEDKKFKDVRQMMTLIKQITEVTLLRYECWSGRGREYKKYCARMLFAHHASLLGVKDREIATLLNRTEETAKYSRDGYKDEIKFSPEFKLLAIALQNKRRKHSQTQNK